MLTQINSFDCNGTPAQNWILERGSTAVKVNGTNFCLDAGSSTYPDDGFLFDANLPTVI